MSHYQKSAFKSALDFNYNQLNVCLARISEQQALLGIVKSALPAELAAHAAHCVVSGSLLLLYSDSAIWTSQIRFFNRAILTKLHAQGQQHIIRLQVRVMATITEQHAPKREVNLPSAENVGLICQCAQQGDESDVLSAALMRLGATLTKRLRQD